MSSAEPPSHVTEIEASYTILDHGGKEFRVKEYRDGRLGCPICDDAGVFDERNDLRRHLSKKHGHRNKVSAECTACGEEFAHPQWRDAAYCSSDCYDDGTDRSRCILCKSYMEERGYCDNCVERYGLDEGE